VLRLTSKFGLFREFNYSIEAVYGYLKQCADTDTAFSFFEDFIAQSTAKSTVFELIYSFKVIGELLFGIFSQSNTLSQYLINNPEKLFWLIENSTIGYAKDRETLYEESLKLVLSTDNHSKREFLLRQYRKNEYLRIASREIIKACSFTEIMKELSDLASALIDVALVCAKDKLKSRFGEHDGTCVIGMGKLGNGELNFSSDIDLLFVHKDEDVSEYYNRLARETVFMLNASQEGGFIYRVDMRLRPGGKNSALSLSIDEYEDYYSTFGQLWEKMALVKAKPVAGNLELGKEFLKTIEPFVYRKSLDIEYIKEIRSLMFKIKKYAKSQKGTDLIPPDRIDVKKGKGCIREIEFIVNYFQLIYGARIKKLKHVGTIEGLNIIAQEGFIASEDSKILHNAYLFFRRVEHKIQLLNEQQTQTLPSEKKELLKLAKKLDMKLEEFINSYINLSNSVHRIFRDIFVSDDRFPVFSADEDIEGYLNEFDIDNAQTIVFLIKDAVKKFLSKDVKHSIIEDIFDYTFNFVDKRYFENCIKGFNVIDPTYTSLIFSKESVFRAFLKMLSLDMSQKLAKHIDIFEDVFAGEALSYSRLDKNEYERLSLAVILRLFLEPFDIDSVKILSRFAIDYIKKTATQYDEENVLAIVGYGKIATGELFVGSDLDIVLLAKENAYLYLPQAQKIIKELKSIYDVDLRLRPYGEKGSILVDIDYLDQYFKNSARPWEKQAAQKSKIIYSGFDKNLINSIYEEFISTNPPTKKDIIEMKTKIESVKGKEYDIKSFVGGISDIEFIAQAVCFENGCIKLGASCLELLDLIRENGILDTEILKEAYLFYTSILNIYRTFGKGSIIKDFKGLEFMLSMDNIQDKIEKRRKKVREIFESVFR
jgi:glutamate-ammonia-ligase adenylyltransferase